MLPALRPLAPVEVRRRYVARVVANATGRCPLCEGVAGVWIDPTRTPAAWSVLPVTFQVLHATQCPAQFETRDRKWFDPRAVGAPRDLEER